MKRKFLILILFSVPFLAKCQEQQWSSLYTNQGFLKADSSLKISNAQFQVWRRIEGNVCTLISSQLIYPPVAQRNGLEGNVVIAFDYYKKSITNIRITSGKFDILNKAGLESVEKASNYIVQEFNYWQDKIRNKYDGTYYAAIDFSLISFEKELKNKQAIPIINMEPGPIGEYGH